MTGSQEHRISVIIVSLNGRRRLHWPLDALRLSNPAPDEIIVVDNGSTDGTRRMVQREYPEVCLIRSPSNLGFAGGNNLGMMNASGDLLVLLNDDTEPEADWLGALSEEFTQRPRLGIAGGRLVYPGGRTIQHLGGTVEANGLTKHLDYGAALGGQSVHDCREVDYVTGAALAIRRRTAQEIGLLDEGFWPIYYEETDWCVRARRAGWEVRVVPACTVVHHESQTTGKLSPGFLKTYHRNRWRFLLKNRRGWELLRAIRAEAKWLTWNIPWDLLWPCALAYAWGALQYPEILISRRRMAGAVARRRRG